MPAYDALLESPIRHVLVRHEQGAAQWPMATRARPARSVSRSRRRARARRTSSPGSRVDLTIMSCKRVDTLGLRKPYRARYAGVLVTGADARGEWMTAWISAIENPSCTTLRKKAVSTAQLDYACCDGDPNPPCYLHLSTILSAVQIKKK